MANTKLTQSGEQVQKDLNLTENMFPNYSNNITYCRGNIVRYGDKLYQCIVDETIGEWESENWAEKVLSPANVHFYGSRYDDIPVNEVCLGDIIMFDDGTCGLVQAIDDVYISVVVLDFYNQGNIDEIEYQMDESEEYYCYDNEVIYEPLPNANGNPNGCSLSTNNGQWVIQETPRLEETTNDFNELPSNLVEKLKVGDTVYYHSGSDKIGAYVFFDNTDAKKLIELSFDEQGLGRIYNYTKNNNVWSCYSVKQININGQYRHCINITDKNTGDTYFIIALAYLPTSINPATAFFNQNETINAITYACINDEDVAMLNFSIESGDINIKAIMFVGSDPVIYQKGLSEGDYTFSDYVNYDDGN